MRVPRSGHPPTIRDVAARAGVSTATVSNVLNATGRASAKTEEKVLAAIAALNFRPNGNAASLRNRRSRLIGLVVPSITNAFFAHMASALENLAVASGYDIVIVTSDEDPARERERILALMARQVEGLIVLPSADQSIGQGLDARMLPPSVVMDRGLGIAGFDTVGLDNEAAGHMAARSLADLGHREIAVLIPDIALSSSRDRALGAERALRETGAAHVCRVITAGATIDGARNALEQELHRDHRVSAVIAATNVATLGAIKAIQGLQLAMPRDISLIGFDDFAWMTALRPYVSAVAQPADVLASNAWSLLLARIAERAGATPPPSAMWRRGPGFPPPPYPT
ncbi:MAG: LacI family DNA-binding transcriptional regulator, partial [Paracoccaceae bacterium]|nr:LacI family DNA-binding transcriptional regulator [Paracoccaceae bacterium]